MEKLSVKYKVKAFGITKEILGAREQEVFCEGETVGNLRNMLVQTYPGLQELKSFFIAVNNVYADDTTRLQEGDEIALIPPVSGG